jgi:hypothetical protein
MQISIYATALLGPASIMFGLIIVAHIDLLSYKNKQLVMSVFAAILQAGCRAPQPCVHN